MDRLKEPPTLPVRDNTEQHKKQKKNEGEIVMVVDINDMQVMIYNKVWSDRSPANNILRLIESIMQQTGKLRMISGQRKKQLAFNVFRELVRTDYYSELSGYSDEIVNDMFDQLYLINKRAIVFNEELKWWRRLLEKICCHTKPILK